VSLRLVSEVCTVNAISVEKPFEEADQGEDICQTCHTCVKVCPANAIFNKKAKPENKSK
jgi:4Fe-4S ferredoxin